MKNRKETAGTVLIGVDKGCPHTVFIRQSLPRSPIFLIFANIYKKHCNMIEHIFNQITDELSVCPFINGIVLGGSRATGMATDKSDIDIGIYYNKGQVDSKVLNEIASRLDDMHRDNLICEEGGWGKWVNCGGWLTIGGFQVDLILRDINRVADCIRQTDEGNISAHYQTGLYPPDRRRKYLGSLSDRASARFLECDVSWRTGFLPNALCQRRPIPRIEGTG